MLLISSQRIFMPPPKSYWNISEIYPHPLKVDADDGQVSIWKCEM